MCLVFSIHPYRVNRVQAGNARARVIISCVGDVKIYGNKPKMLFHTIKKNSLINRTSALVFEGLVFGFSSTMINSVTIITTDWFRLCVVQ